MSSSAASRPLSLRPFLAADGVLLLTAFLIAWRTPDELAGGALFAVVFCAALGAVLMILPFVINEVRQREVELAERQRELAEIVTTSNANTSRWGSQWAAAATGLEDAASLASRSLVAAERLPALVEQQVATLERRLAQANADAKTAEERAAERVRQLADGERVFAARAEALILRVEHSMSAAATIERASADLARLDTNLRERHLGIEASLATLPAFVEETKAARASLQQAVGEATARVEATSAQISAESQRRIEALLSSWAARCVAIETALAGFAEQIDDLKAAAAAIAVSLPEKASHQPARPVDAAPSAEPGALRLPRDFSESPIISAASVSEPPKPIMDPFYVPTDGYSALAEAMDAVRQA